MTTLVEKNVAKGNARYTVISESDIGLTMGDFVQKYIEGFPDFTYHYPLSGKYFYPGALCIPFIIIDDDKLQYDVPFADISLKDFISTHHLEDGELVIKTGEAQAGGPGFLQLRQMWEAAWPIIEGVAVFCSISGFNLRSIYDWIGNLIRKRNRPPQYWFDYVYLRSSWNTKELSNNLDISVERARGILKLLGYQYNKKTKLYEQGDNIEEVKALLRRIDVLDKGEINHKT